MAGDSAPDPLQDALIAARLCAIDPGLGGIVLRGGSAARDAVIAALRAALPAEAPSRRLPAHIDDERLLGGIDLTETLAKGVKVARIGLLAEADGGIVVVPMAERLGDATAGRITAAMDTGEIAVERDGTMLRNDARFVLVALDDGVEPDERVPAALAERLAFWIDLSDMRSPLNGFRAEAEILFGDGNAFHAAAAMNADLPGNRPLAGNGNPAAPTEAIHALAVTASALGIETARAPLFALRAAKASARLAGRDAIDDEDVKGAARLVLAPRATRIPEAVEEAASEPPPSEDKTSEEHGAEPDRLDDIVLAAALAALPKDVLAQIVAGGVRRRATRTYGAGERRKSGARGRPLGARAGMPGGGRRLSLIDTLRAAAPWQKLRGREDRICVRRDDLRIRRFETRAEALTIFAVDASGSSALARLAEAKGAVELLLAEAYVKRTQVALVAFRGTGAELLMPPTRSLTRARRSLADLPGGGGTPLAAGLHAARDVAEAARAKGRTPFIVMLTDGRANVAADGSPSRGAAQADALAAAKAIRAAGIAAAFVDISPRPHAEGEALAAAMRARYLPLPRADAAAMHAAIGAAQRG